jgi:hypothetical protein
MMSAAHIPSIHPPTIRFPLDPKTDPALPTPPPGIAFSAPLGAPSLVLSMVSKPLSVPDRIPKTIPPAITFEAQVEAYAEELKTHGVVVIPNAYTPAQIDALRTKHDAVFTEIQRTWGTLPKSTYTLHRVYEHYHTEALEARTLDGHDILNLAPGRYDFPLDTHKEDGEGVFACKEFSTAPIVQAVMERMFGRDFETHAGALPSVKKSNDGPWHRDIHWLSNPGGVGSEAPYNDSVEVKHLPPFYFTVLVPLDPLSPENGTTEFIQGSHVLSYEECTEKPHIQYSVEPGSAVVFDGKMFHRGRANTTDGLRRVLYQVHHAPWYNDF